MCCNNCPLVFQLTLIPGVTLLKPLEPHRDIGLFFSTRCLFLVRLWVFFNVVSRYRECVLVTGIILIFFLMMSERRDGHLASLAIHLEYLEFHLMFIVSSRISLLTWCVLVFCGFVLFLKKTVPNSGLYKQILLYIVM